MNPKGSVSLMKLLGRRQEARHLVLIQTYAGSNPAAPAILRQDENLKVRLPTEAYIKAYRIVR